MRCGFYRPVKLSRRVSNHDTHELRAIGGSWSVMLAETLCQLAANIKSVKTCLCIASMAIHWESAAPVPEEMSRSYISYILSRAFK